MARVRPDLILVGSIFSTILVIGNAFYHKKQFYPSVVHITKSNSSMAVLYFQAFVLAISIGKLMNKIFFGQLRAIEMEHLVERSWFAVTETCLAFTAFRDDFSPKFVALFTILFFLKCFHWLTEDRVDYMERSPVISTLFHIRMICITTLLALLDLYFVFNAYNYIMLKGASVQIVFGFEYAILFISILSTVFKYLLHTIDLQNENPWENKGIYMLYSDLVLGFFRVCLYFAFVGIMVKIHAFPLFAIRPIYLSLRQFKKCFSDVVLSRRAIRNLNNMYPTVTPEQLRAYADTICIICREEMNADNQVKKLPCDHIFHKNCLRSWFQRQQTCPTCRTQVLRFNPAAHHHHHNHAAAPAAGAAAPVVPPVVPQAADAAAAAAQQPQQVPPTTPPPSPQQVPSQQQQPRFDIPQQPATPLIPPLFAAASFQNMMPPFMFPPPPLPEVNLNALTDEELLQMEGDERHHLEARVQCLRNINTLLNGAFVHIQQYMNMTMASSHLDNINGNRNNVKIENDLKFLNKKPTTTSAQAQTASNIPDTAATTTDSSTINAIDNENEMDLIRQRRIQSLQKLQQQEQQQE